MIDSEEIAGRGRRETSGAVLVNRAARQLVAPAQEKLGIWQAEAVKLEVMTQRMRAAGRRDAGLGESVRTLLGVVQMQVTVLEGAVEKVPAVVREHSRVTDTFRVLRLLDARLQKVLTGMGEAGDRPR